MTTRNRMAGETTPLWVLGLSLAAACTHATHATPREPPDRRMAVAAELDSVAVGYGSQLRRDVTGAVGSVVATRDGGPRVARVEELLSGRVPGVDVLRLPNGEYSVRVRGAAMGLSGGEPLFVVDGMPLPFGASAQRLLAGINPGDVARIDVLKDAGSTAIFGARGVNGVIVITTRRRGR